jgi:hypothetical protein
MSDDFDSIRQAILKLPDAQKRNLSAWLGSQVSGDRPHAAAEAGAVLYAEVCRSIGLEFFSWGELRKLKPGVAASVHNIAVAFESSLLRLFPTASRAERDALRSFIVDSARSRLIDSDSGSPTLQRMLSALVPLEELLDDRFPGYRTSGQLSPSLLAFVNRAE